MTGVWAELVDLQDPELHRLVESLQATVLHGWADSTVTKYEYAFQHWKSWALAHAGVTVSPVSEVHFALYLQHLTEKVQ